MITDNIYIYDKNMVKLIVIQNKVTVKIVMKKKALICSTTIKETILKLTLHKKKKQRNK